MNNFNAPTDSSGLLETLSPSKQSKEDQYICDREAYMAGRRGDKVVYTTSREQAMFMMGANSFKEFGG